MPALAPWASLVLLASSALARPQPAAAGVPGLKASSFPYLQARDTTNATISNITLSPIPSGRWPSDTAVTPQADITLPYSYDNDNSSLTASPLSDASVNITLTASYDGVLLETIENLVSVTCSSDSVSLTFNDTDTLDAAYSSWSGSDKEVLLVTNHGGLCDTKFERGFFLSSKYTVFESNLTLVATAMQKNMSDVATYMRANFSGIPGLAPASSVTQKRGIVVNPSAIVVDTSFDFGPQELFSYEDYVSVTANKASVDVRVVLSGYLDFNILTMSLKSLYVDVETAASAELELELKAQAAYHQNFTHTINGELYLVNVPGILSLGPQIELAVGADLDLEASVSAVLNMDAEIPNGVLHLDLIGQNTAATGWENATHHANLTLTEQAEIGVTPFVSVTVGIDFTVLGGQLDLSSGLTPKISFPTTATLDATQVIGVGSGTNSTLTITQPGNDGTCSNGVKVDSDFEFTLDAFVTQYWRNTLYSYTEPIADLCYSWA